MHSLEIRVKQCDNSTNSSRACASDSFIDLYVQFAGAVFVNMVYVNPLINPGSTDYLDYYLEDKNFFTFSRTQGSYSIGYLEDFAIETDESLLPFESTHIDKGPVISDTFELFPLQPSYGIYTYISLRRSS